MKILNQKKGMGLPMVLGITVFIIGLSTTLMSYIIFQTRLVEIDIVQTENYQNAVSDINTVLNIISREQNLDPTFINQLEDYFNVSIEENPTHANIYNITSIIDQDNQVISYLSKSAHEVSIVETIFEHTGDDESDFSLSPLVTPNKSIIHICPRIY